MVLRSTETLEKTPEEIQIDAHKEGSPSLPHFDEYFKAKQAVVRTLGKKRLSLVYSKDDTDFLDPLIFPQTYPFWITEIEKHAFRFRDIVNLSTEKKVFSDDNYPSKVYLISIYSAKPSQGLLLVNSQVNLEEVQEALLVSKDLKIGHGEKPYQLVKVKTHGNVLAITPPKLGQTISSETGKISSNQPLPPEEYLISYKVPVTYGGITAETYSTRIAGLGEPDIFLHQVSHLSLSEHISKLWQLHHTHPDADKQQVDAAINQLLKLTENPIKKQLAAIKEWSRQADKVVNSLLPFVARDLLVGRYGG